MPRGKYKDLAEELAHNAAKMRGAGPDDPIDWDSFSTSPMGEPKKMGRMHKIKGIATSLLSPSGRSAGATPYKLKKRNEY